MQPLSKMKIGFVGLGLMGKPMALNLRRAGAQVVIFNRSKPVVEELVEKGFIPADSPAEVARRCPVVICAVSDTDAVEKVLFDKSGVITGGRRGSLVIDMGTTDVVRTREFAAELGEAGIKFIDAPVSGGQIGAQNASLSIMAGADVEDYSRARCILQALGSKVVRIGGVGTGQIAKAANQIIVGLTIGAVAEAFALASHGGADIEKVRQALLGGFASSQILDMHGQRMIESRYEPGGKSTTQRKDLFQALAFAKHIGIELPATEQCLNRYDELIEQGQGGLDHSALFTLY